MSVYGLQLTTIEELVLLETETVSEGKESMCTCMARFLPGVPFSSVQMHYLKSADICENRPYFEM